MALVSCNDCGTEISSDADPCPKCGRPTGRARARQARRVVRLVCYGVIGVAGLLLALMILGRGRRGAEAPASAPVTVEPSPAPGESGVHPATSTAAASQAPEIRRSGASFTDAGDLDECVDLTITTSDARASIDKANAMLDKLFGTMKNLTAMQRRCAEEFSDKTILATCSTNMLGGEKLAKAFGEGVTLTSVERYYSFERMADDGYHKNCIDVKGTWAALDKNSAEYKDAERKWQHVRLRRDAERAIKAAGQ